MELIRAVSIRNFRSILDLTFEARGLNALIGGNGSGKSNVLRALNLFFNGVVEATARPAMPIDFHKPWRSTSNRFIEVDVSFALPPAFAIRQSLRESFAAIGITAGTHFALRKRWERDALRDEIAESIQLRATTDDAFHTLSTDEARVAAQFLRLIRFRYVPNQVHPSEVLAAESAALQEIFYVESDAPSSPRRVRRSSLMPCSPRCLTQRVRS